MSVPSQIRRSFGIIDDATVGGTNLERILAPSGLNAGNTAAAAAVIPQPNIYYPVTGGNLEPGLERIDRKAEVRDRRAVSPMLAFRAAPVMTVPFPVYRVMVDKFMKKTLAGADTTGGSSGAGFTHSIPPVGFGVSAPSRLPSFYAQIIRDDLNHMVAGCVSNKLSLSFPLEGEATGEAEIHALFYGDSQQPQNSSPTFVETENVLALRDASVFFDEGTTLTTPGKPTLTSHNTGGVLKSGTTYNYQVVAYNSNGQTLPGGEATTGATVTGSAGSCTLTWTAVTGALGYRIYGRVATTEQLLLADVGNTLEWTDTGAITPPNSGYGVPTSNSTGTIIPDLISFDFSYVNNVLTKWYAGRCVGIMPGVGSAVSGVTSAKTARLWFPTEFKIGGQEDISYALQFGNTNTAQEFNREYSAIQQLVFSCQGGAIPGTSPTVFEEIQITLYNAQPGTGGGPDPLAARGDTTYRVEGSGFYSSLAGNDMLYASKSGVAAAIT